MFENKFCEWFFLYGNLVIVIFLAVIWIGIGLRFLGAKWRIDDLEKKITDMLAAQNNGKKS